MSGLASRALGKLYRVSSGVQRRLEPDDIQRRRVIDSTRYSMVDAPDEAYYADQYWRLMLPHLSTLSRKASVLDLGCSQGRFSLKAAEQFPEASIVGCDLSASAIEEARRNAGARRLRNVQFRLQDIAECLASVDRESVDAILLTEVTFFYPEWVHDFPQIVEKLKRGGILAASFRSQYFDALHLVRDRHWSGVTTLLTERSGAPFGSSTRYSWSTAEEVRSTLEERGLTVLELCGIGCCSGIPSDPHDSICRPSQLSDAERAKLMELELGVGRSVPDGGRYILAVGRKA